MFNLPPRFVIRPLTREVFTPPRLFIIGRIEECVQGSYAHLGLHLCAEGGQGVYSHPTLFIHHRHLADNTAGWVHIMPDADRGTLVMRPFCLRRRQVPSGEERFAEAPIAVLEEISVDAVLLLAERIRDAGGVCVNRGCEGAGDRQLDLRRSVLLRRHGNLIVLCSRCFRQECERNPAAIDDTIIDGRRLPMRAPTAYLTPP